MRNVRAWPQQCWRSCANGSNIVALRFGDHGTKEMLGLLLAEKFDWFQTFWNNGQQHPTTCNRVCKRRQHVTSNNVGSCLSTMLRPFARSLRRTLITQGLQRLMGCILPTMHCRSQHCWELLHPLVHHCQHARSNSQHCWRNNVGSCFFRLHAA